MDTESYIQSMLVFNPLRELTLRAMIKALQLPEGSRGLDAGCGIGLQCLLLADEVGLTGHVTGLDISSEMLDRGREIVKEAGLSERISFQEGDVNTIPFDDNTFDWVWSADTIWIGPKEMECPAEDPLPLVKELARVVKPGGNVAILFWSSQKLLPGYPLLEAYLNTTSSGTAPFTKGMSPKLHFLRALGWLREAGLEEPTAHTFIGTVHAPLSGDIRSALTMTFQMLWGEAQSELIPEDWAEYQRLCQPESPDFILNLPDYYAFFTYSMFLGRAVG